MARLSLNFRCYIYVENRILTRNRLRTNGRSREEPTSGFTKKRDTKQAERARSRAALPLARAIGLCSIALPHQRTRSLFAITRLLGSDCRDVTEQAIVF